MSSSYIAVDDPQSAESDAFIAGMIGRFLHASSTNMTSRITRCNDAYQVPYGLSGWKKMT
jgi:hypothetical protein